VGPPQRLVRRERFWLANSTAAASQTQTVPLITGRTISVSCPRGARERRGNGVIEIRFTAAEGGEAMAQAIEVTPAATGQQSSRGS